MSSEVPTGKTVFCCINDIQITNDGDKAAAQNVVKAINNLQNLTWPAGSGGDDEGKAIGEPAAVFVNGDITQDSGGLSIKHPGAQLDQFEKIFLKGLTCPVYAGLGNHDLSNKDQGRAQMWDYIRCLYKGYREVRDYDKKTIDPLIHVTSIDANLETRSATASGATGGGDILAPDWGKYSFNYSVDVNDIHFVQLHRCGGDKRWGRAGGLKWLAKDLANVGTDKRVIIGQHFGLKGFSLGDDTDTSWTQAEIDTLISIIRPYNVIALFHGHDHEAAPHYAYQLPAAVINPIVGVTLVKADNEKDIEVPKGYSKINVDLNKGAHGKYIYLCYQRLSANPQGVPITGLRAGSSTTWPPTLPAGYDLINQDANEGTKVHEKFVYVCTTTLDKTLGPPLVDIQILDNEDTPPHGYIQVETDMNEGARGDTIYLCYQVLPAVDIDIFNPGSVCLYDSSSATGGCLAIAEVSSFPSGNTSLKVVYGVANNDGTISFQLQNSFAREMTP